MGGGNVEKIYISFLLRLSTLVTLDRNCVGQYNLSQFNFLDSFVNKFSLKSYLKPIFTILTILGTFTKRVIVVNWYETP